MRVDQVKRLKELEKENVRLKKLVDRIVALASQFGRYGYRRITAMLHNEGWLVNHKRVERIWRQEGLNVPQKQPKRKRLWVTDGSGAMIWLWSERAKAGLLRILAIIDEYTRECLSLYVARSIKHQDVLDNLYELFTRRGTPEYIRSDNTP